MTARPCRHLHQRVISEPDGSRWQRCVSCGAHRSDLPPVMPRAWSDEELRLEAERRAQRRALGQPFTEDA